MTNQPVSVIVCRVGRLPTVEPLVPIHESYFAAARKLINCETLQVTQLSESLEIWSDEDALATKPRNRYVSAPDAERDPDLFEMHAIHGDFLIVRYAVHTFDGPLDALDSDWTHYLKLYETEDLECTRRRGRLARSPESP